MSTVTTMKKVPTQTEKANALEESIRHWERLATGERRVTENIYWDDCALCKLYNKQDADNCDGCPVKERTGKPQCKGTPWEDVMEAMARHGKDSKEFKLAALDQLFFLRSLVWKPMKTAPKNRPVLLKLDDGTVLVAKFVPDRVATKANRPHGPFCWKPEGDGYTIASRVAKGWREL